jgi:hypothetical protein
MIDSASAHGWLAAGLMIAIIIVVLGPVLARLL